MYILGVQNFRDEGGALVNSVSTENSGLVFSYGGEVLSRKKCGLVLYTSVSRFCAMCCAMSSGVILPIRFGTF